MVTENIALLLIVAGAVLAAGIACIQAFLPHHRH